MEDDSARTYFLLDHPPTPVPSQRVVDLYRRAFVLPPWNNQTSETEAFNCLKCDYVVPLFQGVFAEEERKTIGFSLAAEKIFQNGHSLVWVNMVCVDPDRQGRGIGRTLIEMTIEAARRRGVESVGLTTLKQSPAAKLYEKLGFKRSSSAASTCPGYGLFSLKF